MAQYQLPITFLPVTQTVEFTDQYPSPKPVPIYQSPRQLYTCTTHDHAFAAQRPQHHPCPLHNDHSANCNANYARTATTHVHRPRHLLIPQRKLPWPVASASYKSRQPSGRRRSNDVFLSSSKNPSSPSSPGPGRGVSRAVRAPKMAQDGYKRASESPRWPPISLNIAQHGSI